MTRRRRGVVLAAALVPALGGSLLSAAQPADRASSPPPPLPAVAVPAGWQPQPTLIEAARTAAAADLGPRAMAVGAWGDPVAGCFAAAIAIDLDRSYTAANVLGQLRTALAGAGTVDGWRNDDQSSARASVQRPGWHAAVQGVVIAGNLPRLSVVACFYNERSPARCQAACAPIVSAPTTSASPTTKPRMP